MTANTLRDTERPVSSRRQVVERAEAFLNAHVGEPISIAALSRAAGVSERSLRNAFYDVRGMSPKRSVVRTRLAQVRRALSDAQGTRGAVTKRERFIARAVRDVLTLLGIGFLAAAVYQLLVGTIGM